MLHKFISILLFISIAYSNVNSQTCTTLGQNPSTAFPVCGTSTFSQTTVPYCGGRVFKGICSQDEVADYNPFWYKFTCFKAGKLAFLITPNDLNDDYDWEIFDITGHNPGEVYTNTSLFVACNWSGNTGLTGASAVGKSLQNCAGPRYPTFSAMPNLILGHNYLLLVSHFTKYTPSQNGYNLSFDGGTASITDPLLPNLVNASAACNARNIYIKINKQIKCNSIDIDGSDFTISKTVSKVISASGIGCASGFDTDSLTLTLDKPLPPGNYTIKIKYGNDGNTLLDNCDRNIDSGDSIPLVILPLKPTPFDSLKTVGCAPQSLQFIFKKNILCSSIAADGSDFFITGTSPVTIISAAGNCVDGESKTITINLSAPIAISGSYQVTLTKGNDGNTLIDECSQETPAGATLSFITKDTVSAEFTYKVYDGCKEDTVDFFHLGKNGVNQWLWYLDYSGKSNTQNPIGYFDSFGKKNIILEVSNGVCSDTVSKIINLDNTLKASFETNNLLCPEDTANFINKSIGDIINYSWDFGNGTTSMSKVPEPIHYPILSMEKIYPIKLIVENSAHCFDTTVSNIKVVKTCYIAVPNAFTPNGDGINDYLYPLNAYKAINLDFSVYNRIGQLVFHTTDWTVKWDGRLKGNPQDPGIFVWILKYTSLETGKKIFQKGSTVLIR